MPATSNENTEAVQPKTIKEVSSAIRSAGEQVPPEQIEGEDGVPVRPASPADEEQTSPVDGQAVVPAPRAKTPEELAQNPKEVLGEEVDQGVVDEMAADTPDGHANDKSPRTLNDISKEIKNA